MDSVALSEVNQQMEVLCLSYSVTLPLKSEINLYNIIKIEKKIHVEKPDLKSSLSKKAHSPIPHLVFDKEGVYFGKYY